MGSYQQEVRAHVRRHDPGGSDPRAAADWAVASFSTDQLAGSGGLILTWEEFRTTNPDIFSTSAGAGDVLSNTAGDGAIRLEVPGIVLVDAVASWEAGTYYRKLVVNGGGGETDAIANIGDVLHQENQADDSADADGTPLAVRDTQWFNVGLSGFPAWFTAQAVVGSGGASKNVTAASLTVILLTRFTAAYDETLVYS